MPLSLRKQAARGTVGLDIDGSFLAAAQVADGVVSHVVSQDLPDGVAPDGEVRDADALAREIKQLFGRGSLPKDVRLGVANQQIVVRQLELPHIDDDKERDAAVRFQAAEAVPMPLEDAILDHQIVEQVMVDGVFRDRIVVVAARRSMIALLLEATRKAGLKPQGIDLNAFALVRALAPSDDHGAEMSARVYCHLGHVTNLAIARGRTCVFTRPLRTAWLDGDGDTAEIARSLAEEIRLSIDFHMSLPGARPVDDVLLSGPVADLDRLVTDLGDLLDRPVSRAEPLGHLDANTLPSEENPSRFTVAAGLALGASA